MSKATDLWEPREDNPRVLMFRGPNPLYRVAKLDARFELRLDSHGDVVLRLVYSNYVHQVDTWEVDGVGKLDAAMQLEALRAIQRFYIQLVTDTGQALETLLGFSR